MDFLLDTCTLLWMDSSSEKISKLAQSVLVDSQNKLYLSSVSVWEIAHKNSLGKLPLWGSVDEVLQAVVEEFEIGAIGFESSDARERSSISILHKDPFDLMLICQAQNRGLTLVTPDPAIKRYPIPVLW